MPRKTKLQKAQKAIIYEDPITRLRREGEAKLIELVRENTGDGLELWDVEFKDEPGQQFFRTVDVRDKVTSC